MSNFKCKVKIKGEIKEVNALDNYFGHHQYGYDDGNKVYREDEVEFIKKKARKELQDCLTYCQSVNGLPYCKNCGLSQKMIDDFEAEVREEIIKHCEEVIKEENKGGAYNRNAHRIAHYNEMYDWLQTNKKNK